MHNPHSIWIPALLVILGCIGANAATPVTLGESVAIEVSDSYSGYYYVDTTGDRSSHLLQMTLTWSEGTEGKLEVAPSENYGDPVMHTITANGPKNLTIIGDCVASVTTIYFRFYTSSSISLSFAVNEIEQVRQLTLDQSIAFRFDPRATVGVAFYAQFVLPASELENPQYILTVQAPELRHYSSVYLKTYSEACPSLINPTWWEEQGSSTPVGYHVALVLDGSYYAAESDHAFGVSFSDLENTPVMDFNITLRAYESDGCRPHCENQGLCVNKQCICPHGFAGPTCTSFDGSDFKDISASPSTFEIDRSFIYRFKASSIPGGQFGKTVEFNFTTSTEEGLYVDIKGVWNGKIHESWDTWIQSPDTTQLKVRDICPGLWGHGMDLWFYFYNEGAYNVTFVPIIDSPTAPLGVTNTGTCNINYGGSYSGMNWIPTEKKAQTITTTLAIPTSKYEGWSFDIYDQYCQWRSWGYMQQEDGENHLIMQGDTCVSDEESGVWIQFYSSVENDEYEFISTVKPACPNNCNGAGLCTANGTCICYEGFSGSSCTVGPTVQTISLNRVYEFAAEDEYYLKFTIPTNTETFSFTFTGQGSGNLYHEKIFSENNQYFQSDNYWHDWFCRNQIPASSGDFYINLFTESAYTVAVYTDAQSLFDKKTIEMKANTVRFFPFELQDNQELVINMTEYMGVLDVFQLQNCHHSDEADYNEYVITISTCRGSKHYVLQLSTYEDANITIQTTLSTPTTRCPNCCSKNGYCYNNDGPIITREEHTCECNPGWTGESCSEPVCMTKAQLGIEHCTHVGDNDLVTVTPFQSIWDYAGNRWKRSEYTEQELNSLEFGAYILQEVFFDDDDEDSLSIIFDNHAVSNKGCVEADKQLLCMYLFPPCKNGNTTIELPSSNVCSLFNEACPIYPCFSDPSETDIAIRQVSCEDLVTGINFIANETPVIVPAESSSASLMATVTLLIAAILVAA